MDLRTVFSLTPCDRTARDGIQALSDSKPLSVCMQKCDEPGVCWA